MCCPNSFHPVAPNYTSPGPQTVTEDDKNVRIDVSLDANPFPSFFTWSRNGVPITSSSNVALTANSITFTTVQRDNAGMYTVYSNNTAGSGSTTFEVIVQCKLPLWPSGIPCACIKLQLCVEWGSTNTTSILMFEISHILKCEVKTWWDMGMGHLRLWLKWVGLTIVSSWWSVWEACSSMVGVPVSEILSLVIWVYTAVSLS